MPRGTTVAGNHCVLSNSNAKQGLLFNRMMQFALPLWHVSVGPRAARGVECQCFP